MKGLICFYSCTGNTEWVCRYLAKSLPMVTFDWVNLSERTECPDFGKYGIVGFATFTDWWGIPHRMDTWLSNCPIQSATPAFVLNTYAHISGKTLTDLAESVRRRGFRVVAGHSIRTPGNYPPSLARGKSFSDAPTKKDMDRFTSFVGFMISLIDSLEQGATVDEASLKIGLVNRLLRRYPRTHAKQMMGPKKVDHERCSRCGSCVRVCAYNAPQLHHKVSFNESRCYGCWSCYNHCPQKAIHTYALMGQGQYPGPSTKLRSKLPLY
ncbi:MAG: EFR1 family ferrodoxin [Bacillota bacterium]